MSKIEEFWEDITLYHIEFTFFRENTLGTHQTTLALKRNFSKEEIKELIKPYFNNIVAVTCVDELFDGLFLKEEFYMNKKT